MNRSKLSFYCWLWKTRINTIIEKVYYNNFFVWVRSTFIYNVAVMFIIVFTILFFLFSFMPHQAHVDFISDDTNTVDVSSDSIKLKTIVNRMYLANFEEVSIPLTDNFHDILVNGESMENYERVVIRSALADISNYQGLKRVEDDRSYSYYRNDGSEVHLTQNEHTYKEVLPISTDNGIFCLDIDDRTNTSKVNIQNHGEYTFHAEAGEVINRNYLDCEGVYLISIRTDNLPEENHAPLNIRFFLDNANQAFLVDREGAEKRLNTLSIRLDVPYFFWRVNESATVLFPDAISSHATLENATSIHGFANSGKMIFSYSATAQNYTLKHQGYIFERNHQMVAEVNFKTENPIKAEYYGYSSDVKLSEIDLFPSFVGWYRDNIYLAPLSLISIVFGSISLLKLRRYRPDG